MATDGKKRISKQKFAMFLVFPKILNISLQTVSTLTKMARALSNIFAPQERLN